MLAKMIDKIVSLKETKTFEIGGQTYTDGLERQPGETDLELKKRIAFLKQAERRAGNR